MPCLMLRKRAEPYIGMAAILEMIQTNLTGVLTIHHGHMPIIEITSPTTATGYGHWRMFCFGRMEGGSMALTAASMGTGITTRYMSAINRMAYQNLAPDAFVATGSA